VSYEGLNLTKVEVKPKPSYIPNLDFKGLPEYVSSDEDEPEDEPAEDDMALAAMLGQKNKNKSF
jgi:hypothetical protein